MSPDEQTETERAEEYVPRPSLHPREFTIRCPVPDIELEFEDADDDRGD